LTVTFHQEIRMNPLAQSVQHAMGGPAEKATVMFRLDYPASNAYQQEIALHGKWDAMSHHWFSLRGTLAKKYAWAIPNTEAIRAIAALGKIVEIGAGTGYWASLLEKAGAEVAAYDIAPYANPQVDGEHFQVLKGDVRKVEDHPDHALLLCWPCYDDPMAQDAAETYAAAGGRQLAYIGENGGCTATYGFEDYLLKHWRETCDIRIPQWPGIHDYVRIFERL
jgi:hypothetical protein